MNKIRHNRFPHPYPRIESGAGSLPLAGEGDAEAHCVSASLMEAA
jgi:hypothetical protein